MFFVLWHTFLPRKSSAWEAINGWYFCDFSLLSTAGLYVHKMGLPVELVCAVNENDIVHRAISTGVFTMSEVVQQTWSTAMDIQVM